MRINTIKKKSGGGSPEESDCWSRYFETQCRERGIRVTAQRLAVYRALSEDVSHPTAESIYDKLRPTLRSLSLATVYRVLEALEKEELVRRLASNGASRFDANLTPHQHLFCRICGSITDFVGDVAGGFRFPFAGPDGFIAEEMDVKITGRCKRCQNLAG
jgi:Fur family transcriptional regulator, peroxide stress response regulator